MLGRSGACKCAHQTAPHRCPCSILLCPQVRHLCRGVVSMRRASIYLSKLHSTTRGVRAVSANIMQATAMVAKPIDTIELRRAQVRPGANCNHRAGAEMIFAASVQLRPCGEQAQIGCGQFYRFCQPPTCGHRRQISFRLRSREAAAKLIIAYSIRAVRALTPSLCGAWWRSFVEQQVRGRSAQRVPPPVGIVAAVAAPTARSGQVVREESRLPGPAAAAAAVSSVLKTNSDSCASRR